MAGFTGRAEVAPGVVIHRHGEVDPIFVVLFDRGDDGGLALQGEIHDVGAAEWPEADPVSDPELDSGNAGTQRPGLFDFRVPAIHDSALHAPGGAPGWFRAAP